jgi:hypothetical protein
VSRAVRPEDSGFSVASVNIPMTTLTDLALAVATKFRLALLEPPFDLLAKLPLEFRRRPVEYGHFDDVARLKAPTFVKPADALNKSFDAGIYGNSVDIRASKSVDRMAPVLFGVADKRGHSESIPEQGGCC